MVKRIAVIGGGLAGLAALYALRARGARAELFEAADRVGGVIRSERIGDYLVEHGANSMGAPPPEVRVLLTELGLWDRRVPALPSAHRRYLVRDGRAVALPTSPLGLLTTPLLSARAKGRIVTEPWRRAPAPEGEESLAAMIRRRFGQEVVDYAIDPVAAGVYAGDPNRLSARFAFPRLAALQGADGSVLRGAVRAARAARAARLPPERDSAAPPPAERGIFAFAEGLQAIPDRLAAASTGSIHVGAPVHHVRRSDPGWTLSLDLAGGRVERQFDAVVCAAPAHRLRRLLPPAAALHPLDSIEYLPIAILTLGFPADSIGHPLDGFGMLFPRRESRDVLGVLFSSSIFPDRAPAGHTLLTVMTGGDRDPEVVHRSDDELQTRVLARVQPTLAIRAAPVFQRVIRWPAAIPQYDLNHAAVLDSVRTLERDHPGLVLAGNYHGGVSVGDALLGGLRAADRALGR
jgi:protoporphyrinogen/coproporphyrinogen III oxidase